MDAIERTRPFHVYEYHFLDDLSFIRKPEEVLRDKTSSEVSRIVENVRQNFLAAGWEGDGSIGMIWLAPFIGVGEEDTYGTYVWHVKQSNNGTSWIGSQIPLNLPRLGDQNHSLPWKTHAPVAMLHSDCAALIRRVESLTTDTRQRLEALKTLPSEVAADIREELILGAQGNLVAAFHEFLDDAYLQILIHVLQDGNRENLRIGRFKVNLNPTAYAPPRDTGSPIDDSGDGSNWFTVAGLIGDIWKSYRFEPLRSKLQLLTAGFSYNVDDRHRAIMLRHVALRNCIQHQQKQVSADALKEAGFKEFEMLTDDGSKMALKAWSRISFSTKEVELFADVLIRLAIDIDRHVNEKVKPVTWIPMSDVEGRLTRR